MFIYHNQRQTVLNLQRVVNVIKRTEELSTDSA